MNTSPGKNGCYSLLRKTKCSSYDYICHPLPPPPPSLMFAGAKAPKHLEGKMAGDFGFDPLGLGTDPERLKWYAEAEKTNGRWAMAACAGILFTELLGKTKWFEAGAEEYWMPNNALIAIEAVVMGFFELKRFQGWKETGVSGFVNSFPFDPAGMNSSDMAVKEVKNGRLAMLATAGFLYQETLTGQGAVEQITSGHLSPFGDGQGAF